MQALSIILASLGLLLLNAFFVASEFALISARRSEIEGKSASGGFLARQTLWSMENVSLMMATAQIGITVATIALGALAKPALAYLFQEVFSIIGLSDAFFYFLSVVLSLTFIAFLHVVFAEMVPKNIALARPSASALLLSFPLRIVSYLIYPLVWFLNIIANAILRLVAIDPRDEINSAFTRDEVSRLVDESRREGKLDHHEGHLLSSALQFEEKRLDTVLIKSEEWVSLAKDVTPGEIENLTAASGYSRFPLKEAGDFISYIHVKDALEITRKNEPFPRSRMHALPVLRDTDTLRRALEVMQRLDVHLARVVDRENKTLGLVTFEDVLEELIGEIRDATNQFS
jgi:CBS domain containing-hemolysin-like protein